MNGADMLEMDMIIQRYDHVFFLDPLFVVMHP